MRKSGAVLAMASLAWALVVTAARAARYPNNFARAHWMLDYRFGVIKRGLVGSVMSALARYDLVAPGERAIARGSFVIFGLFCAMLLALAWRILRKSGWSADAYLSLAAFMTSAFVVTAAHLMGYFDHIVFLLTFGAVWLVLRDRSWPAGVIGLVAVLVHESFLVVGFPMIVLATAMQAGISSRRTVRARAVPLALPIAGFVALAVTESFFIDAGHLRQELVGRLGAFPFIGGDMHLFVPEWLTTTTAQNLREQAHAFVPRVTDRTYYWFILPSAVPLWLLAVGALGVKRGAMWALPMAAACGAPLLLHLVAWDTARIWSYVLIVALGCAWIAHEQGPVRRPWPLPLIGLAACPAIYWNFFQRYPLLDSLSERFTNNQRMLFYAPFVAAAIVMTVVMALSRGDASGSQRARAHTVRS
jgi:hypothetical protein